MSKVRTRVLRVSEVPDMHSRRFLLNRKDLAPFLLSNNFGPERAHCEGGLGRISGPERHSCT